MTNPKDSGIYLCEVEGFKFIDYALLNWDGNEWWRYHKDYQLGVEGWFGLGEITIKRIIQKIDCINDEKCNEFLKRCYD